ncbi:acyl-CoA dehydrogenase family protein [Streptomyces sp. CBMA29]|uniref:acyl-CoA dehydrogenase family protein n=1 Tax=Streptomyces sp. CBMA29 TaxID=1896314 RepID=UPI001661C527|nr:acyl-CoA dehydrogenase family protein [Streptomyces sp. CBMA29]MBD0738819.1 acyl-CoA dehydrogenase [Streptomyces sp. CBMA29]
MDFDHTDEQRALRDAVRGLLGTAYGTIQGRRDATAKEPGYDESMWSRLAAMGVLGLPFAEEAGGMGAGPVEVGVVAEEIGRVLAPEPFVEAVVLCGGLLARAGADVSGIADGTLLPAYVGGPGVTARRDGERWVLDGGASPVLNGARADLLVVVADVGGTPALFTTAGGERTPFSTYDGGRAARVAFDATAAGPLGDPAADATGLIAYARARAQVAYAHEALGAMERALEITRDYLRDRRQFGKPLSAFQNLSFRASDMYVSLELARSTVLWASMVLAERDETGGDGAGGDGAGGDRTQSGAAEGIEAASRAKLRVAESGRHIGQEAVQLHGGIGMTMEYQVGHYAMRLTAIEHLLGDRRHHLSRLAAAVGDHRAVNPLQ